MASDIYLYQIAYDNASLASVRSSGFLMLDNLANDRPDWYEYWAIRNFLLKNALEDAWYGFFSPKFGAKTQLSLQKANAIIRNAEDRHGANVVLFSPQPDMGANFLNVFEQAELFDPGFIDAAQAFLSTMDIHLPIVDIVMDSRQIVYSNYFAAKPIFWKTWFSWTEKLFLMAEDPGNPLSEYFCKITSYGGNAQRKVFLLERFASLLLTTRPEFISYASNSFEYGWSMSRFRENPEKTYINDALKIAFKETGFPQYMQAYRSMRDDFIKNS